MISTAFTMLMSISGALMKRYTCSDYRQEMILAGLRRRLAQEDLGPKEKERLMDQIRRLEAEMGMD